MIPILYPSNETQFTNNGLGRLPDCLSCSVTEERNGIYELELVYPTTGHNYGQISIGKIVYTTHDATKTPQPFVIYKKSTPIDGHVTFSAHHISYRLSDMVVKPFSITGTAGQALAALGSHSVTSCPFTFSSDRSTRLTYTVSKPDTIRRLLGGVEGSILDVYGGGDYTFDKFNVIMGTRGADRGVTIRYGKQMTELTADQNEEGTYNGVVPFWANQDTMVTLPEWYVSNGTPTALAVLDLSSEWQEAPTVAQLRQKAQERLTSSAPWNPDENVTVSFVIQPEDYADIENLQRVVLCDTVSVIYPAAGVSTKIRVIKVVYDPLTERYTSIELGTPQTSLAQAIKEQAVSDTLKQTPTAGWMTEAIQNATDLITGGLGGHVVIGRNADGEPEEILIMDTDSTQTAVNVIRMNQAGIGFSTSGYAGPFTSAWTIDGEFNTDFINVLNLSTLSANAGTITAGVLQSADYQGPATGSEYATLGMIIDLDNKAIRTVKTVIKGDGTILAVDGTFEGTVNATEGYIGNWHIVQNGLEYEDASDGTGMLIGYGELHGHVVTSDRTCGYNIYPGGTMELYSNDSSAYISVIREFQDQVLVVESQLTEDTLKFINYGGMGGYVMYLRSTTGQLELSGDTSDITFIAPKVKANENLSVNKTYGQDGQRGFYANVSGDVFLTSSSIAGSHIYFYYNQATTATSYIYEPSAGELRANAYFSAKDYSGSLRQVPTSFSTDGNRVAGFGSDATHLYVSAQWGTTGSTYVNKSITVSSSDIRLKENVEDSEVEALDVIRQMKVREFDWKDDREEKHQKIGLVADELEEIDPRLAVGGGYDEDGNMNIKSVDTFYLVGYLVKAVQELTEEVERLKRREKT